MHPRHDAEGQRKQGTPSAQPGAYEGNAPANDRMPAHGAFLLPFPWKKLEEIKKQTQEKEQADQNHAFRIKLILGLVILVLLLLCGLLL